MGVRERPCGKPQGTVTGCDNIATYGTRRETKMQTIMRIKMKPNGYLVMDTCCFVNYCKPKGEVENNEKPAFNYDDIRKFIEKSGYMVLITPYTMYECIQNCFTPEIIQSQREAFERAGEFWVVNMNHLLGKDFSYKYGPNLVEELDFENLKLFLGRRNQLKWRYYSSQTPKIRLLAQIIAIIYVLLTEMREDSMVSAETSWKCQYIDEALYDHRGVQNLLELFYIKPGGLGYTEKDGVIKKAKDAKDNLVEFVDEMANQMIALGNIHVEQLNTLKYKSVAEYQQAVLAEQDRIRRERPYEKEQMRKRYVARKNNQNDEFDPDKLMDMFFKNQSTLLKEFYKLTVDAWFQKGSNLRKLGNSIIDFVNLDMLEAKSPVPLVYMTEEDLFIDLMNRVDDKCLNATKEFYKKFYRGQGERGAHKSI